METEAFAGTAAESFGYGQRPSQREPVAGTGADRSPGVDAAKEFLKCFEDVVYFTDTYGIIDDAQGSATGQAPFHLWEAQEQMLTTMMTERLIIMLKARQLGMSWCCCAYALWQCLFYKGRMGMIFSKGKVEANEMIRRINALYNRLPDWLLAQLPKRIKDNTDLLEWDNGSRVQSMPATEDAGSSFTASFVVLDEFAKMQFAEGLYRAVKPTIDGGGQLIVLSSAKGMGNPFYDLWIKTEKRQNDFKGVFLPYYVRPGRDDAWYEAQLRNAKTPDDVLQEYPRTAQEAFLASGTPRFHHSWIQAQTDNIQEPIIDGMMYPDHLPGMLAGVPGVLIYRTPSPGRNYLIGADPCGGLSDSNYSPATVFDLDSWEEVALLYGKFEPSDFAEYLAKLGEYYNGAVLNIGRNNHGHAVIATLVRDIGYLNIAQGPDREADGTAKGFGWPETVKYKPMAVDALADALKDGDIIIRSQMALSELSIYQTNDNGSTSAPGGKTDDLVSTWYFLVAYAKQPRRTDASVVSGEQPRRYGSMAPGGPGLPGNMRQRVKPQRMPLPGGVPGVGGRNWIRPGR